MSCHTKTSHDSVDSPDVDVSATKELRTPKLGRSNFKEWLNSPTKGFVFFYTFTMLMMVFGNGIILLLMSFIAAVYGRRVAQQAQEHAANVIAMAQSLRVAGRLGMKFFLWAMVISFVQLSIHASQNVPELLAVWCQYLLLWLTVNMLLVFVSNFIRLGLDLPPFERFLSPYYWVVRFMWRTAKSVLSTVVSELKS